MNNQRHVCTTLTSIAQKAGDLALRMKSDGEIIVLDWREFVTVADKAVDNLIWSALNVAFPGIPIYSEESGDKEHILSGWVFIVDPIDGTNNYANGFGPWAISIAAVKDGVTRIGVVHDPETQRTFYAYEEFEGAFCQSGGTVEQIQTTHTLNLRQSHVWTDWVKGDNAEPLKILGTLKNHTTYPRIAMCTTQTLMRVAQGHLSGFVHAKPGPEDIAAAAFILEKAGGHVTTLTGEAWSPFASSLVATSDSEFHQKLLEILNQ